MCIYIYMYTAPRHAFGFMASRWGWEGRAYAEDRAAARRRGRAAGRGARRRRKYARSGWAQRWPTWLQTQPSLATSGCRNSAASCIAVQSTIVQQLAVHQKTQACGPADPTEQVVEFSRSIYDVRLQRNQYRAPCIRNVGCLARGTQSRAAATESDTISLTCVNGAD